MKVNSCKTCGGKVEYSPDDLALKCDKCLNLYQIEKCAPPQKKDLSLASTENENGHQEWKETKRTFQCQSCGAQIVLDSYEMTTRCSYCNTPSMISTDALPGLEPDAIIPFKISKEKANLQFKEKIKKKLFLPNAFKKNLPKTQIGATYLSSFSFSLDAFASYKGVRAVTRTIHTKDGIKTITEYESFSGTISHVFDNILIESSDRLQQHQINSVLPYDFKECFKFNDDFLTGFNVGYYNETVTQANKTAEGQALNSLDRMIRRRHGSVQSLTIYPQYTNQKYSYVLLPLYFINFKYKDEEYLNLMNGQTGVTSGKVPRSAVKILFFTFFIIAIVVGFPLLITLLTTL